MVIGKPLDRQAGAREQFKVVKFSAVILAGGDSRRMGRDKAWIAVDGRSLLARQLELVTAAGAREVFISGRPEADYSSFGCPVLLDERRGGGPLGGIERALAAASHSMVLVIAVDLPFLEKGLVASLLGECTERAGAVPTCAGRVEPLVAFYPKACHPLARARLEQERFAAQDFAMECSRGNLVKLVPIEAFRRDFTNWNRPQDMSPASG